ncbi:MAG: addiction module protein [Desulfuromonadales bacterium]|nr:addiction module protein [Desulfuromonadales bacterium]
MSHITAEDLFSLSIPERIQLVEDIWDSIAVQPEKVELSSDTKGELDKRLDEYEKNPQDQSSWDEVRSRL